MTRVRIDLNTSLDGYASAPDPSPDNPMGKDWGRLTAAYAATRTFRQRVLGDTSGAGTTGVDDTYAAAYFEGVGAEIMGAGMFGLHSYPDAPDWKGWWGDEPPFGAPVYVLTHTAPRASIAMQGGTTFHFRDAPLRDVLAEAIEAAGGLDVRIGGGAAPPGTSCAPVWSTVCTWVSPRSCWVGASGCGTTCAVWTSPTR